MSISIANVKESNSFLNILFNNLTSVIFLSDREYKVRNINNTFGIFFDKRTEEVIGQLCGNAIGCSFTIEEGKTCGSTTHCSDCILRQSIKETFTDKTDQIRKTLQKDFYIASIKSIKYLQYTTRYLCFNDSEFVILIIDDITEIEEQKKKLQEKDRELIDSITYAQKIQSNILPLESVLSNYFTESFIFFKPRDIVSGDFYWLYKKQEFIYCAVA